MSQPKNSNGYPEYGHEDKDDVKKDIEIYKDLDLEVRKKVDEKDIDVDIDLDKSFSRKLEFVTTKNHSFNLDIDKEFELSKWDVDVGVRADKIIQESEVLHDKDVNDIDANKLIDVDEWSSVKMDDVTADIKAIGKSFNGDGNDGAMSVNQSNEMVDDDVVKDTKVEYKNHQAPDIEVSFKYSEKEEDQKKGDNGKPHTKGADEAGASTALFAGLSITAPDKAFQTAHAEGGTSYAGDGVRNTSLDDANNGNLGDGALSGDAIATADASAFAKAFTAEIIAGGNQQANFATVKVIGGSMGEKDDYNAQTNALAGDHDKPEKKGDHHDWDDRKHHDGDKDHGDGDGFAIKDSYVQYDDDLNDVDVSELINVEPYAHLNMDDVSLNVDAIANSFNGAGNDWAFDVNQTNDLVDNDCVANTQVSYHGGFWNGPFQNVSAYGGHSEAGSGIKGLDGNIGNGNGGDGMISGATAASADAIANAEAFTANIVVGANLQVNNFTASVIGGDSTIVDDMVS